MTQFPLSLLTDDEHKQTNIQTNTRDRQTNILSLVAKNEHEQKQNNKTPQTISNFHTNIQTQSSVWKEQTGH